MGGTLENAACPTIIHSAEPEWRNWQTHQLEGLAGATPCRFKSCLGHSMFTEADGPVIRTGLHPTRNSRSPPVIDRRRYSSVRPHRSCKQSRFVLRNDCYL